MILPNRKIGLIIHEINLLCQILPSENYIILFNLTIDSEYFKFLKNRSNGRW